MQQVNPVYFPFDNNGESVQETRYGQFAGSISVHYSYLCIKGVMKAFVAHGVTLGKGHKRQLCPWYIQNFMSGRSFEFYNNLGRFNFKITTQKSGRWNKPVIVITVVTA
jgi:hypothetical protein